MKKGMLEIFSLILLTAVLYGCATTERPVRTAVDTTYNAVQDADQWIRKNLW